MKNLQLFQSVILLSGFISLLFCSVLSSAAYAADASMNSIHITDFITQAVIAFFTIVSAVAAWGLNTLIRLSNKKFGIQIDDAVRFYLESAMNNGIAWAKANALKKVSNINDPQVKDLMVAMAANYVLSQVPDAIKHFNLTEANITDMIVARLQKFEGPT